MSLDAVPQTFDPRYPIGRFDRTVPITSEALAAGIETIAKLPAELSAALVGLSDTKLDTPYREGGWTVRRLVHHIADSHMNAVIRVKLALTEDAPTICVYDENAWAKLADSDLPVAPSVSILDGLHARWAALLSALQPDDWRRAFRHPERGLMSVETATLLYAWHCKHHVAHITTLRQQQGW